ncbi:MAG TPA: polysaccharide deacetylase family protein [Bacillales bacterium]|nr:polysaccharide deacetylase family protein [Bacillales bacterium]
MKGLMMLAAVMLMLSGCSGQTSGKTATASDHVQAAGQVKKEKPKRTDHSKNAKKEGEQEKQKASKEKPQQKKKSSSAKKQNLNKQQKPKYYMAENYYIKPIGHADPKVVLLTIDDAPDQHAVEMAKTLKKLHAKAIFFVMGDLIDTKQGKAKLKKIYDMGFPVGNHTYDHPYLSDLSEEKQRAEIVPVYKEIKQVTGEPVKFFRAPHGDNTDVSDQLAAQRGVLVMNWSYGYDWHQQYQSPQKLTKVMLNPVDPPGLINGSILLLHDRPWTAKALPNIVKGLRQKGFKILDPALLKTPEPK